MLLRTKDREEIIKILRAMNEPIEVWAFGSRVRGTAHEGSDLDLVVRTMNLQALPHKMLSDLNLKFIESNIPILIQIFDWASIPKRFQQNILTCYEVFFSNISEK